MRDRRRRPAAGGTSRALGLLAVAAGLVCLSTWALAQLDAATTRVRVERALSGDPPRSLQASARERTAVPGPPPAAAEVAARVPPPPPAAGEPVGRLEIVRRGVEAPVLAGVDEDVLRRAAGWIPGTSLPGSGGNCALAAHRDSFFAGLEEVVAGDVVELETPSGRFAYRVEWTRVVEPEEVWVLDLVPGEESLTLVTCYPFRWVGPASRRFVVRAVRR